MGLDQYATARKGEARTDDEGYTYYEDSKELAYWRKHPSLQGWMEDLWIEKGNSGEFNCVDVELTLGDLDSMEEALDENALPETVGFFFGENSEEHYAEQDREFIVNARAAIKQGYTVVYSSWW
jgi:hypothetical protein|tara:strand:+ start:86 stop:457 length:372 start_codon:yes stop_codon:yes gene_type:complete